MSELFHKSEFIPPEEKYADLEAEHDFLDIINKVRAKKQRDENRSLGEGHGYRGRDHDFRKLWKKEERGIENKGGSISADQEKRKTKKNNPPDSFGLKEDDLNSLEKKMSVQPHHIMDDFLSLLRKKGLSVSTPEWMQFITVVENVAGIKRLSELIYNNELLYKFRLYTKSVLVKNKNDEAAFHEAFDEYFELVSRIFKYEQEKILAREKELKQQRGSDFDKDELTRTEENQITDELKALYKTQEEKNKEETPEIKEQLGIKEVDENLSPPEGEHKDDELVHGGKEDQHNDILRKADLAKQGGGAKKEGPKGEGDKGDKGEAGAGKGDKGKPSGMGKGGKEGTESGEKSEPPESPESEQQQLSQKGFLVGGGKGKSIYAERIDKQPIVREGERVSKQKIAERKERVGRVDRRTRYEVRPDKVSMREVIRNIRRIISDVSEMKGGTVDVKQTVENFARRDFRIDYKEEREKQPEIVLFIDVGGPVDEWSPLVNEVVEAMTEGLTKLEVYLFHNNLYGYVWKPDPKNLLASSYAEPDSLLDVKKIVKHRKKVIIYGDAEMSYSEFEGDGWPPSDNNERVERFGMGGEKCLNFIKKKADAVVWINPVFQKEWKTRDNSRTIRAARRIIPMHDLTVGGVEDAIKELMKK